MRNSFGCLRGSWVVVWEHYRAEDPGRTLVLHKKENLILSQYLLTGVAGFIASTVAESLLTQGHGVVGVDNMNDTYDVRLKQWRLSRLMDRPGFKFYHLDITDREKMRTLWETEKAHNFDAVINLAARSGVPPSVKDPWVYLDTNIVRHVEPARIMPRFRSQ